MKFLLLFLVPIAILSQNKISYDIVADYSMEWQPDTLDVNSKVKTENFKLYLSNNQSFFISENRIGLDTLIFNNPNVGDLNKLMGLPQPSSNKRIFKTAKKIVVFDAFMSKTFKYEDNIKFNWELTNVKDTINNLIVRQAKTSFRGRDYTAWYSEDIPISAGPYKFYGLPGLIVKIVDANNHINYTLISFSKLKKEKEMTINYDSESQNTTLEEYQKAYFSFMDNPIPVLESEGMVFNAETKKIIREKYKERTKKSNNFIERNQ